MKKVIVAIDGSETSKRVIDYALHYAAREGMRSCCSSTSFPGRKGNGFPSWGRRWTSFHLRRK